MRLKSEWFLAISIVFLMISLVSMTFAMVYHEPEPSGCWRGMGEDLFLAGNPRMYNDTQMDLALRTVALHALKEHMYTLDKGYVCADTAVDVWDLLYSQGIKSSIGVGRAEESCKDFECANHAWVIVRHGDDTWIIETTGGEVMRDDDIGVGQGYLSGMEFSNPREMKEAAGIIK